MDQGFEPSVAGARTRSAQVDYDPATYTKFEKQVAKQLVPFYSFNSRMGQHTAMELLTNPGGPTAQLVKALDRSQGRDPSVPNSVLEGTSIPLGQAEDGTKRYLTNLGLMHEPAVKMLGSGLSGDTRGLGYDLLGMMHPVLSTVASHKLLEMMLAIQLVILSSK